jgi:hypothetical protein
MPRPAGPGPALPRPAWPSPAWPCRSATPLRGKRRPAGKDRTPRTLPRRTPPGRALPCLAAPGRAWPCPAWPRLAVPGPAPPGLAVLFDHPDFSRFPRGNGRTGRGTDETGPLGSDQDDRVRPSCSRRSARALPVTPISRARMCTALCNSAESRNFAAMITICLPGPNYPLQPRLAPWTNGAIDGQTISAPIGAVNTWENIFLRWSPFTPRGPDRRSHIVFDDRFPQMHHSCRVERPE